jgi:aryl-alcohol dehydrogenase-like predicted oxidoreductase
LPTQVGLHRKHVVEGCNDALKRLQVEYLDLFFCHRPDKNTPIEETVWTMHQLIMAGQDPVLGNQRMERAGDHGSAHGRQAAPPHRPGDGAAAVQHVPPR